MALDQHPTKEWGPPIVPARVDRRIWLLALGTFALANDAFVIAGVMPHLARDLSVSVELAGQVVTVYALAYAIGSPLLASATARWSRSRTIVVALSGFACAQFVCAAAPSLAVLAAGRMAAGLFAALYIPSTYASAADLVPDERRGSALSKVALGTAAGMIIGVPLGTWIGQTLGWRATFSLGLVFTGLAAISLRSAPIVPAVGRASEQAREPVATVLRPAVVFGILATLFWSLSTYTVYTYLAVLFGARLKPDGVALLLLAYGLGGLTGSQAAGRIVGRFGADWPIIVAICISALNFAFMPLVGGLSGTIFALFVMACSTWTALVAQQSRLIAFAPARSAQTMSLLISAIYIGSASGAALGGLIVAKLSPNVLPRAACAATLVGLVVFLLGKWLASRSGASPS
jgi:MFS transporter, DHA1 family, inner membrane transport protein